MQTSSVELEMLPASYGDCMLVTCAGAQGPWRMLIDTGPQYTYPALRARLEQLPSNADGRRRIDLFVVSHIDHDHIGGVAKLLADKALKIDYGDIWFNAPSMPGDRTTRGPAEGQAFADALELQANNLPWNIAWSGKHAVLPEDGQPTTVTPLGGPTLTLLSPTLSRLGAVFKSWKSEIDKLTNKQSDPAQASRSTRSAEPTLEELASRTTPTDGAVANGSSIALLLEHRGVSLLLGADAFPTVLVPALKTLAAKRNLAGPLPLDVFKLSHHGSRANVTSDLMGLVKARHCIVSTDNTHFKHPDDEAMARVILGQRGTTIWFTYDTERNRRWARPELTETHGYAVQFPAPGTSGVTLRFG